MLGLPSKHVHSISCIPLVTLVLGWVWFSSHVLPWYQYTPQSKKEKRLGEKLKKRADREIERREKQEKKKKFKESEALRRGKSQKKERKRYFGSPLDTVATEEGVPLFVRKCVAIIEEGELLRALGR